MMRKVYVVLLHSPMVSRHGEEITTAVTNLDIHDIARTCRTYGIEKYFIVNPEPEQERLVAAILGHWDAEVSQVYHPSRAEALGIVKYCRTFEETFNEITVALGGRALRPFVAMPDARELEGSVGYFDFRTKLETGQISNQDDGSQPLILVFGTGWGIAPRFYSQVDCFLKPIWGLKNSERPYNHLSVRAAAAIVLDRLFGR